MNKITPSLARLAAAGAAIALMGAGQPAPVQPDLSGFKALRLSAELARWGRENRDPWALAAAARLRRDTPLQFVRREQGDAEPADITARWLEEASAMAGEDPRLASFLEDVRAMAFKGRQGGPRVSTGRVPAGLSHRFAERFEPGRPAVVYLEGDGDTDLTLQVRAPGGGIACQDASPGDVKMCSWTAREGGGYAVEVLNRGRVENRYALATN